MFEPIEELEMCVLKIATVLQVDDSSQFENPLSKNDIERNEGILDEYDAVFTSDTIDVSDINSFKVIHLENVKGEHRVLNRVAKQFIDKLKSDEMPNNVDLSDIITLNKSSSHIYTFDNAVDAVAYLKSLKRFKATGCINLSKYGLSMDEFEQVNRGISTHLPETAWMQSSFSENDALLIGVIEASE